MRLIITQRQSSNLIKETILNAKKDEPKVSSKTEEKTKEGTKDLNQQSKINGNRSKKSNLN